PGHRSRDADDPLRRYGHGCLCPPTEHGRQLADPTVTNMTTPRPIASLSLDLDNKWSYLKTHGDPEWERLPSYLDVVVPRVLDILKARNLTITVFIVGQDAALDKNRELLRAIAAAGHEIGNHSFHHAPWPHPSSEDQPA